MMQNLDEWLKTFVHRGLLTHYIWSFGLINSPQSTPQAKGAFLPGGRTFFDLASLTKALITTQGVLRAQWPKGTTLGELSPQIPHPLKTLTWEELLGHTSGLPAWRSYLHWSWVYPQGTFYDWLNSSSLSLKERGYYRYSDVGFWLLGNLLGPEKMKQELTSGLSYHPLPEQAISTGWCPIRRIWLEGQVHDENAWSMGPGAYPGHAGVFGSEESVWNHLKSWILSPLGEIFFQEQLKRVHSGLKPLGWQLGDGDSRKAFAGHLSFGHLGFTGTAFWYDPQSRKLLIFLTNRVISGRTPKPWFKDVRSRVYEGHNR